MESDKQQFPTSINYTVQRVFSDSQSIMEHVCVTAPRDGIIETIAQVRDLLNPTAKRPAAQVVGINTSGASGARCAGVDEASSGADNDPKGA